MVAALPAVDDFERAVLANEATRPCTIQEFRNAAFARKNCTLLRDASVRLPCSATERVDGALLCNPFEAAGADAAASSFLGRSVHGPWRSCEQSRSCDLSRLFSGLSLALKGHLDAFKLLNERRRAQPWGLQRTLRARKSCYVVDDTLCAQKAAIFGCAHISRLHHVRAFRFSVCMV